MILDSLENAEKYFGINPRFQKAFEFLRNNDFRELEGRIDIDGAGIYAIVVRTEGQGHEGAELEIHKKYIDIQLQQSNYQEVTSREAFGQILEITVEPQDEVDVSYWIVAVLFNNKTGSDMLYERKVEIPGPRNILYGPQQPNLSDY